VHDLIERGAEPPPINRAHGAFDMTRALTAIALVAAAFTITTATVAQARVTYGMNGNATDNGSGTADCQDGTNVSFDCPGIQGVNPFQSGDFQSTPGSAGMQCAASACGDHGGVVLSSVVFEVDEGWATVEAEEAHTEQTRVVPESR